MRSPAAARRMPSAIWLRQELPVQRMRTFGFTRVVQKACFSRPEIANPREFMAGIGAQVYETLAAGVDGGRILWDLHPRFLWLRQCRDCRADGSPSGDFPGGD